MRESGTQNKKTTTKRKSDICVLFRRTLSKYRLLGGWFLVYIILTILKTCENAMNFFRLFGELAGTREILSANDSFLVLFVFIFLFSIVGLAVVHIKYMLKRKFKPFVYTYLAGLIFVALGVVLSFLKLEGDEIVWRTVAGVIEIFVTLTYFHKSNRVKVYFLGRAEYRKLYCAAPRHPDQMEEED